MNNPKIYLPLSFLVVVSLVHLSLSVPTFSLIIHFPRLLFFAAVLSILTGLTIYYSYKKQFDFDNLYKLTASSILFSFVVWLAVITYLNIHYTTKNCYTSSYQVVGYKGRYTSGLGRMEKDEIKANQWILTILKDDKIETFVLDKDISTDNRVTNEMDFQFCKGVLGTEFLNLKQLPR